MSLRSYFYSEYLEPGEKILAVAHRHIFVLLKPLFRVFFIGFALPGIIWFLFDDTLKTFCIIWMVLGSFKVLYETYGWYYDVWLITDRAVIDVKSPSLFEVSTTRVEYHMVEGVTYTIAGFLRTIFNFGDMMLEKIGSGTAVTLSDVNAPKSIERHILHAQEKYVEKKSYKDHRTLNSLLSEMLHKHAKENGLPEEE